MKRALISVLAIATVGLAAPVIAKPSTTPNFAAAVAKSNRPADETKLDESRKPAEVLKFLGLKKGMKAADVLTGSGYWAEIMANAIGAQNVTAFEPNEFYASPKAVENWDALKTREPGITLTTYPFKDFAATANAFDFTIINLSYHDLYWESEKYKIPHSDPAAFVKALYAATKTGGIVGIIDHVGASGDTRAIVDAVHRIDPETVKADFKAAGFVLEAESNLLANPADDHSKLVFDPEIRGKTDRFTFRFRKPKK